MKDNQIVVIGSYNMAFTIKGKRFPEIGETFTGDSFFEAAGGKGSNQVIAASRFGADTTFVGCVGNDQYGKGALDLYRECNISTDYIKVDDSIHTGVAFIMVDEAGRNMIEIASGANLNLLPEDVDAASQSIAAASLVGFQLEGSVDIVEYGLRKVHELGSKTLLDPAPAQVLDDSIYQFIDYIKPNETEATILTGIEVTDSDSALKAGKWFLARGVKTAIVTLGEQGSVLVTADKFQHFPAPIVESEDSTGAGDIFSGALMAALAKGTAVEQAITIASHAAALSVTRLGVIEAIPELDELNQFIQREHPTISL